MMNEKILNQLRLIGCILAYLRARHINLYRAVCSLVKQIYMLIPEHYKKE